MPRVNGRELFERLLKQRPQLKVLFMSGYTEEITAQHGVLNDWARFLQKPFTALQLSAKVRETLDG